MPQFGVPPQPSAMVPQFFICPAHVIGVQPHTFAVPPPPQVCGVMQVPQVNVPPQPFGIVPQFLPAAAHVVGTQPHTFAVPPPPQV